MEISNAFTQDQISSTLYPSFLQRNCPACFSSSQEAKLSVQSSPSAEQLPPEKHGKFLSGYTNQRVFFSYYRCSKCELLYCPTYFTQNQLDDLYKSQSENMGDVPLNARARTQAAYYELLTHHHKQAGDYLEIGADIGLFAKFFAEHNQTGKMFLYEPNHEVHNTLKSKMGNKNYEIITKNYSASDIAPNTLSTAVIIHTLDHVLEPRELMKGIYQNLKPGGVVFIVTHDESSLLARLLKKKWPPYTLQHPHLFKPSTIQYLLKKEGFTILASHKTPNYFPFTHFIKGGLAALGWNNIPIPNFANCIIPIKLGNIATIAQKPFGLKNDARN